MGYCNFPDNPDEPIEISINQKLPFMHVPEIISHEIAHFIVGKEGEEHGEQWEIEFEKINKEYDKLAKSRILEIGKETQIE